MPLRFYLPLAGLVLMTLGVGGCASGPPVMPKERALALEQSAETYRKLIRWSDFAAACQYYRPRTGEAQPIDPSRFEGWKVSTYDVGDAAIGKDFLDAQYAAEMTFFSKDTGRAGSLHEVQRWWFDAETKRWYLESPPPDFAAAAARPPSR